VGSTTVHVWPTAGVSGGFSTASCPVTVNALTLQTSNSSNNGYVTFGSIATQQWTGSAVEPAAPTITVKVNGGTNTLTASDYDVSYSNNTNEGSAVLTITGKGNYTGTASTNFTITKDPGIALSSATVGMVIATNGKAYTNASTANTYSTAAAIIAYKGNGENNSSYNTGLAIALADVSDTHKWYTENSGTCVAQNSDFNTIISDLKGIEYTNKLASATCGSGHVHAAAQQAKNYSVTTPTGCSQWFLPTIGQWKLMLEAMKGSGTLSTSSQDAFKAAAFATFFSTAGGTNFQASSYWSSVECYTYGAWSMYFLHGYALAFSKSNAYYVRPVLAF